MTTEKQIDANRENGKLGGVKTEEGKNISKYNALKHGLLSKAVLMKNEDEELLVELGKKMRLEMKPETELELLLVDRIITGIWRLKRALGMEEGGSISITGGLMYDPDKYFRYEIMLERSIYKALHELQRLQSSRNGEKLPLPLAIDIDVNKEN